MSRIIPIDYVKPVVHFVGFRGNEYWSAVKVFGRPHFIHQIWDRRARREIMPGDTVVFAKGDEFQVEDRNASDINEEEP